MPNWLAQVIQALVVAGLTAVITVRLSLRRFHSERWWERKADAYMRLMSAIVDLRRYIDLLIEEEEGGAFAEEHRAMLVAKHREAVHELQRATVLGRYLFSNRTVALLDTHNQREGPEGFSDLEYFQKESQAYERLFDALVASSKADLGVK